MMPMHVCLFFPYVFQSFSYVQSQKVLSWERVQGIRFFSDLARGLLQRGFRVSIAAFAGSKVPQGIGFLELNPKDLEGSFRSLSSTVDIVHSFELHSQHFRFTSKPKILTLFQNVGPGQILPKNTVFSSLEHAQRHYGSVYVVPALDRSAMPMLRDQPVVREDFYVFCNVGLMANNQLHFVMDQVRKVGVYLKIFGVLKPFSKRMRMLWSPYYDNNFLYNEDELYAVCSRARAVLCPVPFGASFSYTLLDALACACPVITFPFPGASSWFSTGLVSVVDHSLVWKDILTKGLIEQAPSSAEFGIYDVSFMVDQYIQLYGKVFSGYPLHERNPTPIGV